MAPVGTMEQMQMGVQMQPVPMQQGPIGMDKYRWSDATLEFCPFDYGYFLDYDIARNNCFEWNWFGMQLSYFLWSKQYYDYFLFYDYFVTIYFYTFIHDDRLAM